MATYIELTEAEATTYGEVNSLRAAECASKSGKLVLKFASKAPASLKSKTAYSDSQFRSKLSEKNGDYNFTKYVKKTKSKGK